MTRSEFINHTRFLFNDTATSNYIQRELLTSRPGNVIDGINKVFFLYNRRIASLLLYDVDNNNIDPTKYSLDATIGKITFITPPTTPIFADYYWYKLTDAEINEAINSAAASWGNINPDNINAADLDYCAAYTLAYCYLSAASKASEYYTLSAAGKQVSKSELFNHYTAMHRSMMDQALTLRTDKKKDRGDRDVPACETTASEWVRPYLQDSSGG